MPKGTTLSMFERGQIKAYREGGMKIREIAAKIKRSKDVISKFLSKGENYGSIKRTGRKSLISDRQTREIRRLACNNSLSPAEISRQLNLPVGKRRVQQILHADERMTYEYKVPAPKLLPRHKQARLNFAEKYQFWDEEWRKVIFSDEKKFNLDGPDGVHRYWRNKRHEPQTRHSRNFGGGSLMIWAAFGYYGKSRIHYISTKMNAKKYVELLDEALVDFGEKYWGEDWIFQHDNASVHAAKDTKAFLESNTIPTLPWPAISPDLNPIENLWSILSSRVFAHGCQFDTVSQLKAAIDREWSTIDESILRNLIESMPRRLMKVIIKKGGHSGY